MLFTNFLKNRYKSCNFTKLFEIGVFVLLSILLFNTVSAQPLDSVYIGTATLHDGGVFTYKLQFTTANGTLSGYSLMDINGEDETKATLSGTINKAGNQIQFKELGIVYTKSKQSNQDFCLLQGSLKVKNYNGTKVLKGHFEGYLNEGKTVCANGKLVLISPKDLFKILGTNQEEVDSITNQIEGNQKQTDKKQQYLPAVTKTENNQNQIPQKVKDTIVNQPPTIAKEKSEIKTNLNPIITYEAAPKNVLKVLPGKLIEINCLTQTQTLEIWDNKNIDGDIVTLMQGNTALIKNYSLTGTHFSVAVDMGNKTTDTLRLIAISEGSEPLNTSRIKITTGGDSYFIDATTTIDKEVLIVLRRK